MTTIRAEEEKDGDAVRAVHEAAFGRAGEADLVGLLKAACPDAVSLVAEYDDTVVGHILFSPVVLETDGEGDNLLGMGLGPVAVMPVFQRQGIGRKLIESGMLLVQVKGTKFVVVLGEPELYGKFGFEPAIDHGIGCPWDVPAGAFQARVFDGETMARVHGVARYRDEFNVVA